jgi:hypothetical protein
MGLPSRALLTEERTGASMLEPPFMMRPSFSVDRAPTNSINYFGRMCSSETTNHDYIETLRAADDCCFPPAPAEDQRHDLPVAEQQALGHVHRELAEFV